MAFTTQVAAGLILLDNSSSGWCPRCGEAPSFPWTWAANATGYVDACRECAPLAIADALRRLGPDAHREEP